MKSLKERKEQRAEQRILLAHGGVIPMPDADGEVVESKAASGGEGGDKFDPLTIAQLKDWAKENGAEVPADKVKRDDVLAYVRNYALYLEQMNPGTGNGNAGNSWTGN